jgi:hypothetical protein
MRVQSADCFLSIVIRHYESHAYFCEGRFAYRCDGRYRTLTCAFVVATHFC